jgi:hypothetical protein
MKQPRFPWFGLILVVLGVVLLLRKWYLIDIDFSTILWGGLCLIGFTGVVRGFGANTRGRVFGNTVLFLYGLFFLLRSIDALEIRSHMFFPVTFLVFGIAFLMMYLCELKDWYLLIPAFILGGIGAAFILANLGYLYAWEIWDVVTDYWPVVLILIGVSILFRRRGQGQAPPGPGVVQ